MKEIGGGNVKVSVCIVTFNQEQFLAQCLESLVEQKTNFDFEIVVGDDCSTDGTARILREYAELHPDVVVPIFHEENVGALRNYISVHSSARGIYVAHMDGDDYALPGKLQAQADYLDDYPECAMVFHGCMSLSPNGELLPSEGSVPINERCNIAEFIYRYPSKSWHSAKMYRHSACRGLDPSVRIIDKHIHFMHGLSGLVGFLNRDFGVYRVGVGMSLNFSSLQVMALDSYEFALRLGYDKVLIKKIIAREHFEHGLRCLAVRDYVGFRCNVWRGFHSGHRTWKSLFAYSLSCFPRFYAFLRSGFRHFRASFR